MIQAKPNAGASSISHASSLSVVSIVLLGHSVQWSSMADGLHSSPWRLVVSRAHLCRMILPNQEATTLTHALVTLA